MEIGTKLYVIFQVYFCNFYYYPSHIITLWLLAMWGREMGTLNLESEKIKDIASLVAQWLRIRLPMQGTWVRALVWEDPTCRRATKPVHHNCWACALESVSHNYWARVLQVLKPASWEPMLRTREATAMRSLCTTTRSGPHSPQLEKARAQQQRPNATRH